MWINNLKEIFSSAYDDVMKLYTTSSFIYNKKWNELYIGAMSDGFKKQRSKKFKEAIDSYREALYFVKLLAQDSPDYRAPHPKVSFITPAVMEAGAHVSLARCFTVQKEYKKAVEHYKSAIASDPYYLDSYYELALLLRKEFKQYRSANDYLRKLLDLYKNKQFLEERMPFLNQDELLLNRLNVYVERALNFALTGQDNDARTYLNVVLASVNEYSSFLPNEFSEKLFNSLEYVEALVKESDIVERMTLYNKSVSKASELGTEALSLKPFLPNNNNTFFIVPPPLNVTNATMPSLVA